MREISLKLHSNNLWIDNNNDVLIGVLYDPTQD